MHTTTFPGGEIRAQLLFDVSASAKRTWTFTDASGNFSTCSQFLYFNRIHAVDVIFPADVTLDCSNANTDACGGAGSPTVAGGASIYCGTSGCELNVAYTDQPFDICDGSYKILRTWVVYDWCLPTVNGSNPIYYIQVIKVLDTTAPVALDCPGNFTVSVNNSNCTALIDLPTITVNDNCSSIKSGWAVYTNPNTGISQTVIATVTPDPNWTGNYLVNFGNLTNVALGTYAVTFYIQDDCGNTATCVSNITVADNEPPVAICQEFTQVAIGGGYVDNFCTGPNGPGQDVPGIAEVPAAAFNSGSYDFCGPVWFKVRRMDGGQCGGTSFDDKTKFCCSDIGGSWTVVFRVYDVDPGTGVVSADAFDGHYNDCMVTVLVEDKIKPICQAPVNKTVNCDEFDPLVWYGNLSYSDNCGIKKIDTAITYVPNQIAFEQCNYGQVRRTFTVRDCSDNSSRCTQTITVNYKELYRVYFPDDKNITSCGGTSLLEQPVIYGENCELIGISHKDQVFDVVPDACYKILRTFEVINWCTYNPNLGTVAIQNPNTSTQGARVWIGTTVANYNPNSPDVPTATAKTWAYPAPLTGTATNMDGTPAYTYTQVIKVQDQTPPTQIALDPQLSAPNYTFCDYSTNDPLQWNEDASYNPYNIDGTWSPTCQSHDLCEGVVDLSIKAKDDCTGNNINFRYLLFLDLNGDGVMETTINSEIPTLGFGIREDEIDGDFRIGRVTRDFETDDPDHTKYAAFSLPYGSHKIKWIAEDKCGNDFTKEYPIIVKDCKNPTVVCINGLSVNGMNAATGTTPAGVTLWASDFLKYAEDNCTDVNQIVYAIRDADINPGSGFPLNAQGQPQSSLTWECSQIGTNVVELWAKDKWGNADFCLTYLILTDNTGACAAPGTGSVAGFLKNEATIGVSEVDVELKEMQNNPAFPDLTYFKTDNNGLYNFYGVPMAGDYKITPAKDINPLNGVSTFDLVKMSKHVLNVAPFTTGYEFVAADINHNGQVTTFDIVELRKLILGIYNDFPANNSWRFVSKTHVFDMAAPLAGDLHESMTVPANSPANDFVAVKVGDLTGDAIANNLQQVDDRTNGTLLFNVEDRAVKAGETFMVDFKAAQKVLGSQFTLAFNGLEVAEIVPGAGLSAENFATFATENAIAASLNTENEANFSVKFTATADGQLSSMIGLSSRITKAEAYSNDEQRMDVAIQFRNGSTTTIAGVGFELYQNTPNPVKNETMISFNLAEAAAATLTITDVQGRVLTTITNNFNKGINTVTIDRADLKTSGVVFYQLSSGSQSATKKMVIVE